MHGLVSADELTRVRRFKRLYSRYQRNRDLISVGAYAAGSDPVLDQAIAAFPRLEAFLQQNMNECVRHADGLRELTLLLAGLGPAL
jgi:flagellum-specific ATP synthase